MYRPYNINYNEGIIEEMIYDLQKASMTKRVSAFLLDFILVIILITGFSNVFSYLTDIDATIDECQVIVEEYKEKYGVNDWVPKIDFENIDYDKLTDEQKECIDEIDRALSEDKEYVYLMTMYYNKVLVTITMSIFLAMLIIEFIVPLILKNGQTVGKKIFGIAVMRTDGVRVSGVALFVRSILGKFTLETMLPILVFILMLFTNLGLVGPVLLLGIVAIQIFLIVKTKTNSFIHDAISYTVCVDFASQMIFDSEEKRNEYIEAHKDDAEKKALH